MTATAPKEIRDAQACQQITWREENNERSRNLIPPRVPKASAPAYSMVCIIPGRVDLLPATASSAQGVSDAVALGLRGGPAFRLFREVPLVRLDGGGDFDTLLRRAMGN